MYNRYTKRLFDIVTCLFALFLLAPVMLIIAIVVVIFDGLPILYVAPRTGKNGEIFNIIKYRTMVAGAEHLSDTTSKNDKRITVVGAFLRKWKLDELPQLYNVLAGHMSIVGPRPEIKKFTDLYNSNEMKILSVRPGITDLASIKFRNLSSLVNDDNPDEWYLTHVYAQKNKLRLKYVSEISFIGDLKIIMMTIRSILKF